MDCTCVRHLLESFQQGTSQLRLSAAGSELKKRQKAERVAKEKEEKKVLALMHLSSPAWWCICISNSSETQWHRPCRQSRLPAHGYEGSKISCIVHNGFCTRSLMPPKMCDTGYATALVQACSTF